VRKIFDLASSGIQFVGTGDQSDGEAPVIGILQLNPQLFRLGVQFDIPAGGPDDAAKFQIVMQSIGIEEGDEDLCRRSRSRQLFELVEGCDQAIKSQ
jgi:hypothetical protein